MRFPKQIDLGCGAIKIDRTKTSIELCDLANKINGECMDVIVFGLYIAAQMKIYLAKDMPVRVQFQALLHETAEAATILSNTPYKHDRVLLLESMLTNLLNDRKFIHSYWEGQEGD